jgi:microcystin-dependent protein
MDFAMPSAPTGWLECNGAAVSRTTYSVLFATIGTTWGAGDGSTTFNLPPDRYRRGRNAAAAAVGTLQADQNKSHTHLVSGNTAGLNNAIDHLHAINGTTGVDSPDHTHGYTYTQTTPGPSATAAALTRASSGKALRALAARPRDIPTASVLCRALPTGASITRTASASPRVLARQMAQKRVR